MNTWENITAWFHEAACELAHEKVKPMVNTGDFSLLESMSAVEVSRCDCVSLSSFDN